MIATVEDGKVVRIQGDPDQPYTAGFACGKVNRDADLVNSPERIRTPLRRTGPKGSGQFAPITWDQALDEIAAKLGEIRTSDGPEAVATLGGTHKGPGDWSSWRFACDFGTPNFVSQGRNCGVGEFVTETAVYGWDTIYQAPSPGVTTCGRFAFSRAAASARSPRSHCSSEPIRFSGRSPREISTSVNPNVP